jgi:hypothetical protein
MNLQIPSALEKWTQIHRSTIPGFSLHRMLAIRAIHENRATRRQIARHSNRIPFIIPQAKNLGGAAVNGSVLAASWKAMINLSGANGQRPG